MMTIDHILEVDRPIVSGLYGHRR